MSRRRRLRELGPAVAFLAPNFLGFAVFTAGPVLFSLVVAFSNWSLIRSVPFAWIGLDNFVELAADTNFWLYLINTLYLLIGMPFAIGGSLLLAVLLTRDIRGSVAYRTLFYLPTFTAGVAILLLWKTLYNPDYGPINFLLNTAFDGIGVDSLRAPDWLTSMRNLLGLEVEEVGVEAELFGLGARDALVIMGVWIAVGGTNMLLYIAAIAGVPEDLYEAARIDGAGAWAQFWHVTWPQVMPTTFFIVIMSFIGGLQGGFEQARVMTQGGPAGTTTTLSYYIYTKAFEEFQIGYASAIAWALFALIFAITMVNWRFGGRSLDG